MSNQEYIYTSAEEFRAYASEYSISDKAIEKINSLTDEEILQLVNRKIDESQFAELISEAQEAALTEIEKGV